MFDSKKVDEVSSFIDENISDALREGDEFGEMAAASARKTGYRDPDADMDMPYDDLEEYYGIDDSFQNSEEFAELENYIEASIKAVFREKNDKTLDELYEMPEFLKYKKNEEGAWEEFSRARGYSEEDIENFRYILDTGKFIDSEQQISSAIFGGLEDMSDRFFMIQRKTEDDAVAPEQYKKLLPIIREQLNTGDTYKGFLSPDSSAAAARNALVEMLSSNNTKRVLDDMLDELPTLREYGQKNLNDPNNVSLEEFIADSVEKEPQFYRAVTSFNDLTYDLSFAWPREIGTHVGTRGQASSILSRNMRPDRTDVYMYDPEAPPSSKEVSTFFEEEGETLREYAILGEDLNIPPATMVRGYIRTTNPLVLEEDFGSWWAHDVLGDPMSIGAITDAIENQGVKLNNSQDLELEGLIERAEGIRTLKSIEPALQGRELEYMKADLLSVELGKDFRNWLESLGFDSIKYRNTAEASIEEESPYSYVLFKPQQYKSYTSVDFNPSRPNFAEGGYVIKSGDTLSKIAKDNNTTVAELARLNNIEDVNKIYAGQKLTLGEQVKEAMKPEPKRAPEVKKAPEPEEDKVFNLNLDFAKQFVRGYFATGNQKTEDFSDRLVGVLRDAARNAVSKGQDYITYKDYPQLSSGEFADDWVHGKRKGSLLDKVQNLFTDPVLGAALTVGRGNLVREGGRVYFTDEYDFTPVEKDYSELGTYGKVRKWAGENFPEEGNRIRIDLGSEEEIYGRPEVAMDQQDTDGLEV